MSARRSPPPGLDELLRLLRASGLAVGTREILRLRRAFALGPVLAQDRDGMAQLRSVLAAALVHSPEEREIFEPAFRRWSERWEEWERQEEQREERPAERYPRYRGPAITRQRRFWSRRRGLAAALLVLLAMTGIAYVYWPQPAEAPVPTPPPPPAPPPPPPTPDDSFRVIVDESGELLPPPPPAPPAVDARDSLPFLLPIFGVLCLGAAAWLAWRYRASIRRPPPAADADLPGPPRLPLLPLPDAGPELLDADGERTLVWGVDRHQAEESTPEIDLERSVDATARAGGLPTLLQVPEKRLREVWLWLDGTVEDEALERYAEEIAASLERAGLAARVGGFDGHPRELLWDEGQVFRPQELEGHRQSALVAVMTDGDVMLRHARDQRRERLVELLSALSEWERLVFVDFSDGPALAELLRRHGVACVAPQDLPHHFGLGGGPAPRVEMGTFEDQHLWRAALAVGGRPVARRDAQALRQEIGLEISPWEWRRLNAARHGGPLAWSEEERAKEMRWLRDAGASEWHERALDFWDERLAEEERLRQERGGLEAWEEQPERLYLLMERALLKLQRGAGAAPEAAAELRQLAEGDVGVAAEIRRRLGACVAPERERTEDERMPLRWRLGDLPGETLLELRELGLEVSGGRFRPAGRWVSAMGLLAGLGIVALGAGSWPAALEEPPPVEAVVAEDCPRRVGVHEATGMRFVWVCEGRFRMGSEEDDPDAHDDEKPAHEVAMSGFWIGEREVSNAEYRWHDSEHEPGKDGDLPAVNVDWHEARAFCQALGRSEEWKYDLPSEAQWEYAARGLDGRRYPWGTEAPSEERAVFGRDSGGSPEPVGAKPKGVGPFGTLDQAGNAWEWALDCYDDDLYERRMRSGEISVDPVHEECFPSSLRVLRGGSYWFAPGGLRSAGRDGGEPERRDEGISFRCVRRPLPQP